MLAYSPWKFTFEPTTLFVNEFSEANLGFECSDTPCHRIVDAFQLDKNQFSVHALEKLMVRSLIWKAWLQLHYNSPLFSKKDFFFVHDWTSVRFTMSFYLLWNVPTSIKHDVPRMYIAGPQLVWVLWVLQHPQFLKVLELATMVFGNFSHTYFHHFW